MKKRILCAEDDNDLRDALAEAFGQNYDVTFASDGEDAIAKFAPSKFDVVLSDIKMPRKNGIEFLKYVKSKASTPFILMTGFSELLETRSAYDLGADEFLAKPFHLEELEKVFAAIFENKKANDDNKDKDFCKILLNELEMGSPAPVDIYFRLSGSKYLKIIKSGSIVDKDRIKGYVARGLDALYCSKEEFSRFLGINLFKAREVYQNPSADIQSKRNALSKATESILQDIYKNGMNEQNFVGARDLTERNVNLIKEHPDLDSLLMSLNGHSDYLYAHALGVSLYSTLIATEMGWVSPVTLSRVSLAGLFHDIGIKEISRSILDKPRRDWSNVELKEFESHCLRGRDILNSVPGIPSELASIACQHHENNLGLGYPGKLKRQQIHPIAKLVKVADLFCELTVKGQYAVPLEPKNALDKIFETNLQEIEAVYLAALFSSYKVEMPDELKKAWKNASDFKI